MKMRSDRIIRKIAADNIMGLTNDEHDRWIEMQDELIARKKGRIARGYGIATGGGKFKGTN